MSISNLILRKKEISKIIEKQVKKGNKIIYGSKAMNAQIHPFTRRYSPDYDIYTNTPRKDAIELDKKLDKLLGGNYFYPKPAQHEGTWKVKHKGLDGVPSADDIGIADFSKGTAPNVKKKGMRYEKLSNIIKSKKKILKDPESEYRHDKDRGDLRRIKLKQH